MTATPLKSPPRRPRMRRRNYPMPSPDKIGLTLDEVCGVSGIGMTSVRELIASGQLPARQIGKRLIIRRQDVDEFLQGLPVKPAKGRQK